MLNKLGYTPLDLCINENDEKRSLYLIEKMHKYNNNCSLKFVKRPNRLELKFEKSFTLAVLRNNENIIEAFEDKEIKTSLINVS